MIPKYGIRTNQITEQVIRCLMNGSACLDFATYMVTLHNYAYSNGDLNMHGLKLKKENVIF